MSLQTESPWQETADGMARRRVRERSDFMGGNLTKRVVAGRTSGTVPRRPKNHPAGVGSRRPLAISGFAPSGNVIGAMMLARTPAFVFMAKHGISNCQVFKENLQSNRTLALRMVVDAPPN